MAGVWNRVIFPEKWVGTRTRIHRNPTILPTLGLWAILIPSTYISKYKNKINRLHLKKSKYFCYLLDSNPIRQIMKSQKKYQGL